MTDFSAVDLEWCYGKPFEDERQDPRASEDSSIKVCTGIARQHEKWGPRRIRAKVMDAFGVGTTATEMRG